MFQVGYECCLPVFLHSVDHTVKSCALFFRLQIVGLRSNYFFSALVIPPQPLLMSFVQIFYRDKMVAVSHLIGTDTVPEDTMAQV